MTPAEKKFWANVTKTENGCWLWTGSDNGRGYGMLFASGKRWKAHRFSYLIHKGAIPDGMDILHSCDNPRCVNPEHLRPGTDADNVKDAHDRCRRPRRFAGVTPRLNPSVVNEARRLALGGVGMRRLATMMGVPQTTMYNAVRGLTWNAPFMSVRPVSASMRGSEVEK